jgi:hypothetical protein
MIANASAWLSGIRDSIRRARRQRLQERLKEERRGAEARCASCAFFRNDAAYVETNIAGLASMGSGYASVRAADGICVRLDRYLSGDARCGYFAAIGGTIGTGCPPV